MKIILVVAYEKNMGIGIRGGLPDWSLKDDMKHFKELTTGGVVIMGRKTFESFPYKFRPLPNRYNFIVTRNASYMPEPTNSMTHVFFNLAEALQNARIKDPERVFIIGGSEIYDQILTMFQENPNVEIVATEIDGSFDVDTFFPGKNGDHFRTFAKLKREVLAQFEKNDRNSHSFTIVRYAR